MIYITDAFYYVIQDPYFFPAMTSVVMIGIFIGATIFDGNLRLSRKYILTLFTYSLLLSLVNLSRVIPRIVNGGIIQTQQPLAGTLTNLFVSVAYLAGMYIGVWITKKAHKGVIR